MSVPIPRLDKDWTVETLRSDDGTPLRYGLYCKSDTWDHLLIFINGRTEWLEKYHFLPKALDLPPSTAFLTCDHRGQGASGGSPADIPSYNVYVSDLLTILRHINVSSGYSIIAHSMGGLIGLYGTLQKMLSPSSLVLTSPLLRFQQMETTPALFRTAITLLGATPLKSVPSGFSGRNSLSFETNPYTHDANHFHLIANAPYRTPSPTFGWINQSLQAISSVFDQQLLEELTVPTLVLSGTKETVVDPRGFRDWVRLASDIAPAKVTYHQTAQAKHELLNETPLLRKQAIQNIKHWMKEIWQDT